MKNIELTPDQFIELYLDSHQLNDENNNIRSKIKNTIKRVSDKFDSFEMEQILNLSMGLHNLFDCPYIEKLSEDDRDLLRDGELNSERIATNFIKENGIIDKDSELQDCLSKKIAITKKEFPDEKQAIAVAYNYCRKKLGLTQKTETKDSLYTNTNNFRDMPISLGTPAELTNTIVVSVVLAQEMIQYYHRSELPPWITEQLYTDQKFIPVLKSLKGLTCAAKNIPIYSNKQKLPSIQNHTHFVTDENDPFIIGWITDIKIKDKKLKGKAHFITSKLDSALKTRILNKEMVDVSVGGEVIFDMGGYYEGNYYLLEQSEIYLNHLAVLPHDPGRCPSPKCGLNIDSDKNEEDQSKEDNLNFNHLERSHITGLTDSLKQSIFDIYAFESDVRLIKEPKHLNTKEKIKERNIIPEPNILEDENLALKTKNKELQSKLDQIEKENLGAIIDDLKNKVKDADLVGETLKLQLKSKDEEIASKTVEIGDKDKVIAELQSKVDENEKILISDVKSYIKTALPKYPDEILDSLPLDKLILIKDTISYSPIDTTRINDIKSQGLIKSSADERNKHLSQDKPTFEIPDDTGVDMNTIFMEAKK